MFIFSWQTIYRHHQLVMLVVYGQRHEQQVTFSCQRVRLVVPMLDTSLSFCEGSEGHKRTRHGPWATGDKRGQVPSIVMMHLHGFVHHTAVDCRTKSIKIHLKIFSLISFNSRNLNESIISNPWVGLLDREDTSPPSQRAIHHQQLPHPVTRFGLFLALQLMAHSMDLSPRTIGMMGNPLSFLNAQDWKMRHIYRGDQLSKLHKVTILLKINQVSVNQKPTVTVLLRFHIPTMNRIELSHVGCTRSVASGAQYAAPHLFVSPMNKTPKHMEYELLPVFGYNHGLTVINCSNQPLRNN